jgi:hypothetical protein
MTTPPWNGATIGQLPLASQVNQFLGTHAISYVYTGAEQDNQSTAGSGAVGSNGLYVAQSVIAGGTYSAGRVVLTLALTGTPTPLSITVQTSSGGNPSGTILAGPLSVPSAFVPVSAGAVSLPLSWSVVSGTRYWVVTHAVGDASDFYAWSKSNQVSGASTSPDGVTWTTQAYGLLYQVWDNTVVPPLVHTLEDSGTRWAWLSVVAAGEVSSLKEYTVAQGTNQYVSSSRAYAYTNGLMTSIT